MCVVFAAAAQFFSLAAILWTACIAVALHLSVLNPSQIAAQQPTRLLRYMGAGVWGSSAITLLIIGPAGALGSSGQWCWIRLDAMWAGVVFYFVPLVVVFAYSMYVYARGRGLAPPGDTTLCSLSASTIL